jgi:3-deoxy-manno-octulosonate cytidylyltransferase (CMP-KDO synthetase)
MKTAIVIPARHGSSRFPGKPLALIHGHSLIHRTWAIARAVAGAQAVWVATDSPQILEHVAAFGGQALMTSEACANGTERIWAALQQLPEPPEMVVNFQGDAVLTPPWVLEGLVKTMESEPKIELATPAVRLSRDEYQEWRRRKNEGDATGTFVTFDDRMQALYFSKALIPFVRQAGAELPPVYRHIGLYAYSLAGLRRYLALPPAPLERAEGLEQLRALEHGMPVRVVTVDYRGRRHCSIDKPEDITAAEEIIREEGELVSL